MTRANLISIVKDLEPPGDNHTKRHIWAPLGMDSLSSIDQGIDRAAVLRLIRSVYEPLLIEWEKAGLDWRMHFHAVNSGRPFQDAIIARKAELPKSIEKVSGGDEMLSLMLLDILKYYRYTDPAWRVPLKEHTSYYKSIYRSRKIEKWENEKEEAADKNVARMESAKKEWAKIK